MQSGDPGAANAPQQQHQHQQSQQPQSPEAAPGNRPWSSAQSWMLGWRGSRQLVLVIVAIALLLDNMLLTVVGEFRTRFNDDGHFVNKYYYVILYIFA